MDGLSIFLVFAALAVMLGNYFWSHSQAEPMLRDWALRQGYTVRSLELIHHAKNSRHSTTPGLAQVRLYRELDDKEYRGKMTWEVGFFSLRKIEFEPYFHIRSTDDLPVEPEAQMRYVEDTSEAGVLVEVNRRLDAITSQPNWMEPYDLDQSGHIDEEEWSILRNSVMQQVRAELGEPGVHPVTTPQHGLEAVSADVARLVEKAANPPSRSGSKAETGSPDDSQEILW